MKQYPLYEHHRSQLKLPGGRALAEISPETLEKGAVIGDLGIDADVLRAQAEIAEQAGFHQLAENLRRAAELTAIPDEEILRIYEALRPGRSSPEDLEDLARKVEATYEAPRTTAFLREAAGVLRSTNRS